MKKMFIAALMCALSISVFAGNSQHLTFNGISLANSFAQFTASLKKSGMKDYGEKDGVNYFVGKFNDFKGCDVGVIGNEEGSVERIVVIFPDQTNWTKLSKQYFDIKNYLESIYGNPVNSTEVFKHSYAKKTKASDLMEGLMYDQCDYHSVFASGSDLVSVEICHNGAENSFVRLCYYENED